MTCSEKRAAVIQKLEELGISFKLCEHDAVYTMNDIKESDKADAPEGGIIVKNLFLKEHNSEKYFLVVASPGKNADIKSLRRFLGTKPLSFATEEQLCEILSVERGAVSPLSVINDKNGAVSLIIDDTLKGSVLGVHPNENTSTLYITYSDLEKYAGSCGHMLINMQV